MRGLAGLERAYPVAMRLLDDAYAVGCVAVTCAPSVVDSSPPAASCAASRSGPTRPSMRHGDGSRNAIIQGAAAELFKAWAATVRALGAPLGAQIVLCLHDELLVHAPTERAAEVAAVVDQALADASRRWSGGAPVRFVADTSVIERWSDARADRSRLRVVAQELLELGPSSSALGNSDASVASRLGRSLPSMKVSYCCSSACTNWAASVLSESSLAISRVLAPRLGDEVVIGQVEPGVVDNGVEDGERPSAHSAWAR